MSRDNNDDDDDNETKVLFSDNLYFLYLLCSNLVQLTNNLCQHFAT